MAGSNGRWRLWGSSHLRERGSSMRGSFVAGLVEVSPQPSLALRRSRFPFAVFLHSDISK